VFVARSVLFSPNVPHFQGQGQDSKVIKAEILRKYTTRDTMVRTNNINTIRPAWLLGMV